MDVSAPPESDEAAERIERFIARWHAGTGGQERANYQMFLSELAEALGVARPDPAGHEGDNDYVFERAVKELHRDGSVTTRHIDLYKRNHFVLEAKQSRWVGAGSGKVVETAAAREDRLSEDGRASGRETKSWDVLMLNARTQAEGYVRLLPTGHTMPPFILVCDVGHCIEVYANFRCDGKAYDQFPDRMAFRIYLEDLRKPIVRKQLAAIWTDPQSLDPARRTAGVTRQIAERLAAVSKALEAAEHPPEAVAQFLIRCLFTMFANDVGLLPDQCFREVLQRCEDDPSTFPHDVGQLWQAMDTGGYAFAIRNRVRQFNGVFFKNCDVLPLGREEIGELRRAASHDWRDVDPGIFGALLEQALDPVERRRLGAHYTPRPYVERLVVATVIEPLRLAWETVTSTVERQKSEGRVDDAIATVRAFHRQLCQTRVLDPACGTGNFLYVTLELMKRLEGEVLDALYQLGGQSVLPGLEGDTIDPRQFLGLELSPRAAAIAELVLWIGYLQWHFRTRGGAPAEPILRSVHNIEVRDAVLDLVGEGVPKRPVWPDAEYIVGNPPFMGGKDLRARLGDRYAEALWATSRVNPSADLVMHWWDHAASLLTERAGVLKRFGFVTTNSIVQPFQRRVVEAHLSAPAPVSIVMAVADHPWTRATPDAAAVRIAMTVVAAGRADGRLLSVVREERLETDQPMIDLTSTVGRIHADLSVGIDATQAAALRANAGLCSPGVKLHGKGFLVSPSLAPHLGVGRRPGIERHLRPFVAGRDLMGSRRQRLVIDATDLDEADLRQQFPELYQQLLTAVRPERTANNRESYRSQWWRFGEPRRELRQALAGLPFAIATVETAKHRVFVTLEAAITADNTIMVIATDDFAILGVLSSRWHRVWCERQGGTLEDRPRYTKSRCFDPFPFPDGAARSQSTLAVLARDLDRLRAQVLAEQPELTLSKLYTLLADTGGVRPDDPEARSLFERGLIGVLADLHRQIDRAVAAAYGWPDTIADADAFAALMALNARRQAEEAARQVRWLRPAFQIAAFATPDQTTQLVAELAPPDRDRARKPKFPRTDIEQTAAVIAMLLGADVPLDAASLAARFRQGQRVEPKIQAVLAALLRTALATPGDGAGVALRRFA